MIHSPPRQRAPATPVRPAVPAHQAAYRKKIADETIAADNALAAAHTAKRTAASQRLSGIKHRRPSQSAPLIRSKISLTAAEWRRVGVLGDQLVTGMKPGQRASRSLVIAAMLARLS